MAEVKRPEKICIEVNRRTGDEIAWAYEITSTDAYIAALERRVQTAVDALRYLMEFPDAPRAKECAGKVIDSEQKEQEGK